MCIVFGANMYNLRMRDGCPSNQKSHTTIWHEIHLFNIILLFRDMSLVLKGNADKLICSLEERHLVA